MFITNYYRGSTNKLTGFTFDTERKKYKEFVLAPKDWTNTIDYYSIKKDGFEMPGDLSYYFPTKSEMSGKLEQLKQLGFVEDQNMILDFGIFRK